MNRGQKAAAVLAWALLVVPAAAGFRYDQIRKVEIAIHSHADAEAVAAAGFDLTEAEWIRPAGTSDDPTALRLIVDPAERQSLADAGIAFRELPYRAADPFGPKPLNVSAGYRTWDQLVAGMQTAVANYPALAALTPIGNSWQTINQGANRPIYAMHIRGTVGGPEVVFEGVHHAREMAAMEMPAMLIDHLLSAYSTDALVNYLVDHRDTWIIPCLNPDGRIAVESGTLGAGCNQRKNMDSVNGNCPTNPGVDPNRNYNYQWGGCGTSTNQCNDTFKGPSGASEPEIQTMQNFFTAHNFAAGISYHSYAAMVLWPWGYTTATPTANAGFASVGKRIAAFTGLAGAPTYQAGPIASTIYCASGGSDDWAWVNKGIMHFTVEVEGSDFWPPYNLVTDPNGMWDKTRPGQIFLMNVADAPWTRGFGPYAIPTSVSVSPNPSNGASSVTLSGTFDNTTNAVNVSQAEYWVDTVGSDGAGTAMTGTFTAQTVTASASVSAVGLSAGRHTLLVRGRSTTGQWGTLGAVWLQVVPPTPTASPTVGATGTATPLSAGTGTAFPTATPSESPSATPAAFAVVPNPVAASAVAVRFVGLALGDTVRIYNAAGEVVFRGHADPTGTAIWQTGTPGSARPARGPYVFFAGSHRGVVAVE